MVPVSILLNGPCLHTAEWYLHTFPRTDPGRWGGGGGGGGGGDRVDFACPIFCACVVSAVLHTLLYYRPQETGQITGFTIYWMDGC